MDFNTLVALRIRELRLAKGYTIEYIASVIGSSPGSYSKLENGRIGITVEKLFLIALALDVNLIRLIPCDFLPDDFTQTEVILNDLSIFIQNHQKLNT